MGHGDDRNGRAGVVQRANFHRRGDAVQDRLTGTITRNWRLEAAPALALGRVAVDDQDHAVVDCPTQQAAALTGSVAEEEAVEKAVNRAGAMAR